MLPTTYRGAAVIDGVRHEAEVRLDAAQMCLVIGDTEVLSWPIADLDVDGNSGGYHVRLDEDEFRFEPAVDDGFGDELHLRRRLGNGSHTRRPDESRIELDPPVADLAVRIEKARPRAKPPAHSRTTVTRTPGVLTGRDLRSRTAIVILAALAAVVVIVAVTTGALDSDPSTVVVADPLATPAAEPETSPDEVSPTVAGVTVTTQPVPTTAVTTPPATTLPTPTTVAQDPPPTEVTQPTVTSTPPTSIVTAAPVLSTFQLSGDEFIARWREHMLELNPSLVPGDVGSGDGGFGFTSGSHTRVDGSTDEEGKVRRIVLRGDPSGTVTDDRNILTGMGVMIAITEPDLPPEGRRQLIEALGLDLNAPDIASLNGNLVYRGNDYRLVWDDSDQRIVFDTARRRGQLTNETG